MSWHQDLAATTLLVLAAAVFLPGECQLLARAWSMALQLAFAFEVLHPFWLGVVDSGVWPQGVNTDCSKQAGNCKAATSPWHCWQLPGFSDCSH